MSAPVLSNVEAGRRLLLEVVNDGHLDLIDELVRPDARVHAPAHAQPPDRSGYGGAVAEMRAAFPDLRVTILQEVASGDRVAHRIRAAGTHLGVLFGMPATGRPAEWDEMHFATFDDEGWVIEHWHLDDMATLTMQLGAMPPDGP
jgi:predicted ester cyclase